MYSVAGQFFKGRRNDGRLRFLQLRQKAVGSVWGKEYL